MALIMRQYPRESEKMTKLTEKMAKLRENNCYNQIKIISGMKQEKIK